MAIIMDEKRATSGHEHLHLHTGGDESSARYYYYYYYSFYPWDFSYEQLFVSESY